MITVFTSCHNQSKFLSEAIESVLSQTYGDFEYLLYDDGSTDESYKIMQEYAKIDKRIKVFLWKKQPNVAYLINNSIKIANGSIWTWCPSDDIWLPNLLQVKNDFSTALAHKGIIYSDWEVILDDGSYKETIRPRISPDEFQYRVWKESPIGFTGIWIPMWVFNEVGEFPTHLKYSEDFYWMIKTVIHKIRFYGVHKVLYKKRVHRNQTTEKHRKNILKQMPKIWEELRAYENSLMQS